MVSIKHNTVNKTRVERTKLQKKNQHDINSLQYPCPPRFPSRNYFAKAVVLEQMLPMNVVSLVLVYSEVFIELVFWKLQSSKSCFSSKDDKH